MQINVTEVYVLLWRATRDDFARRRLGVKSAGWGLDDDGFLEDVIASDVVSVVVRAGARAFDAALRERLIDGDTTVVQATNFVLAILEGALSRSTNGRSMDAAWTARPATTTSSVTP